MKKESRRTQITQLHPLRNKETGFRGAKILRINRSTPLFLVVALYLVAQAYTLPIVTNGWWPTWIAITDLLAGLAGTTALFCGRKIDEGGSILSAALALALFFLASYIFVTLGVSALVEGGVSVGAGFGGFQLVRMIQFVVLLWAVLRLPLTLHRVKVLRALSVLTFSWVAISVVLTKFQIVPTAEFGKHIPDSIGHSGPWLRYKYSTAGLGTIGYNHGYVALQLLLLGGMALSLGSSRPRGSILAIVLPILLVATLLSGSRAGFAAALLFAAGILVRMVVRSPFVLVSTALVMGGLWYGLKQPDEASDVLERQRTIADPLDAENLSGRTAIWASHLEYIAENPHVLLTGVGFGSAVMLGNNAHMMPLHVLLELGVLGLAALVFLLFRAVKWMRRTSEVGFWLLVALIGSMYSQETLYPVVSFGHALGLFLLYCGLVEKQRSVFAQGLGKPSIPPHHDFPGHPTAA